MLPKRIERPALICKGELLLDLRYLRNDELIVGDAVEGELLLGLPYLRNRELLLLRLPYGELLPGLPYLRNE